MLAPHNAPNWAKQIHVAFKSGASGQFVIHGNVNDRISSNGQLVNIEHYIRDELLRDFDIVFTYDLGNGLAVLRGAEKIAEWVPVSLRSLPQSPLEAVRFVSDSEHWGHVKGPANTLPMMMGEGPYGNLEMGGMFTVVKVREGLAAEDYGDPG